MASNGFWASDLRPSGPIQRIVSTVPSQTELLHTLGLNQEVVGITLFCVHPQEWFQQKQRIGGTKNLKIDEIKRLSPDIILANKEENTKEQIKELAQTIPCYVTDVDSFSTAIAMIAEVSELLDQSEKGEKLIASIQSNFEQLQQKPTERVVYMIWYNPYMTVGGDTFIDSMLAKAGFKNCYHESERYPEVKIEELKELQPDRILLSSEPFPFQQKHVEELQEQLPNCKVQLVNGEYFSWYGSKMVDAPSYFKQL